MGLAAVIALWLTWSFTGRNYSELKPESFLDHMETVSVDSACARNIVAIQPYMLTSDYLTEERFYNKLNLYFDAARQQGYFNERTVVLLPEYLAAWLVIVNEKQSVATAASIDEAMRIIILSNPVSFMIQYLRSGLGHNRTASAIFKMKAAVMAEVYSTVFSQLAKKYQVTIVGGSILLPGPSVRERTIVTDLSASLYNITCIFHPDGSIDSQVVKKAFPIQAELPLIQACPVKDIPVFDLPAGKTAVLICADSWYPESYKQADSLKAEIVLVNSYATGNNTMTGLWKGYDGSAMPSDVDPRDVGSLTELEAWKKYALPGRLSSTGAHIGVTVFLRGQLWDLGADGTLFLLQDNQLLETGQSEKAGIWNLCFQ